MILGCSGTFFVSSSLILLHPSDFCHQDCCHNFWYPPTGRGTCSDQLCLLCGSAWANTCTAFGEAISSIRSQCFLHSQEDLEIVELLLCPAFRSGNRAYSPKSDTVPLQSAFWTIPACRPSLPRRSPEGRKPRVSIAYATDPRPCCLVVKSGVPAPWINGIVREVGRSLWSNDDSLWSHYCHFSPGWAPAVNLALYHVFFISHRVYKRQLSWCSSTAPCYLFLGQKAGRWGLAAEFCRGLPSEGTGV